MAGGTAVLDRPLAINLKELHQRVVVEVGHVMARALSHVALGAVLLLLLGRGHGVRLPIIPTVDVQIEGEVKGTWLVRGLIILTGRRGFRRSFIQTRDVHR